MYFRPDSRGALKAAALNSTWRRNESAATDRLAPPKEFVMRTALTIAAFSLALTGVARGDQLAEDGAGCKTRRSRRSWLGSSLRSCLHRDLGQRHAGSVLPRLFGRPGGDGRRARRWHGLRVRAADDTACFWVKEGMAPGARPPRTGRLRCSRRTLADVILDAAPRLSLYCRIKRLFLRARRP